MLQRLLIVILSVCLAGGALVWHNHRISQERQEARSALLALDSIQAQADTTKELLGLLGDSVRVFERRVVQSEVQRDSIDRLLRIQTQARADVSVRIDTVVVEVEGEVTEDTIIFDSYEEPVNIRAVVYPYLLPPLATFTVVVDPIDVGIRLSCGEGYPVRPAHVVLETPEWAEVSVVSVQQTPDICNPIPPPNFWSRAPGRITAVGVGVAAGLLVAILK